MKPSRLLLIALSLFIVLVLVPIFVEKASIIWMSLGGVLAVLMLADGLLAFRDRERRAAMRIEREHEEVVPVGIRSNGTITVILQHASTPRVVTLYEKLDPTVEMNPYPIRITKDNWSKKGVCSRSYTIIPHRRGSFTSTGCEIEYPSLLGFWIVMKAITSPWHIKVYPDFWDKSSFYGESIRGVAESAGFLRIRRRGEGTEFRELRDYVSGDSIRHVDWRASSRRDHLVVKAFQEEQDQQILILLDGGYRLHQVEGATVQFEYALRAMLRLAAVSIRQQDSVGAYVFGKEDRYLAPRKGSAQYRALLQGLFDFQSAPVPTSPGVALERCLGKLKRRTFLLLITNLRSEDDEIINWITPLISGRHRLMVVTLQEFGARGPDSIETFNDALTYGAAIRYRRERERLWRMWNKQGIITLDCTPPELSSRLINRYLSLKGQGVL